MSLLVNYTLKDAADHAHQVAAMEALVADLKDEGKAGLNYTCFSPEDPTKFIGVLEFSDSEAFKAFQASSAFEAYRTAVSPTFANPPETQPMTLIASTKS